MATSVATPLIKQFSTIAGIDSDHDDQRRRASTSIAIQFELNRDIDAAAADVQAAIARTQRQLPAEMTTPPSYRKVNPADAPILLLALSSDTVPLPTSTPSPQQVISPALSTIDGVAPGAGLRQPEIRRAHPARSRPRSPRAASASTRCRLRSPPPTPTRRSARCRTTSSRT